MAMTFGPTRPVRERILFYGPTNTGKSHATLTVMRRVTDKHFHIIDTDDSWDFLLYEDEEENARLLERANFTVYHVDQNAWTQQLEAATEAAAKMGPGDFFVFDMMSAPWECLPDWYSDMVFGKDYADYVLEVRRLLEEKRAEQQRGGGKGDRTAPVFDQLRDYGPINTEYKRLVAQVTRANAVGHVLMTAGTKSLGENDDKLTKALYRPHGAKPSGQKLLGHYPHTVFAMGYDDGWVASRVKDRGKRRHQDFEDEQAWSDFTKMYLGPFAGWKMQKAE